MRLTLHRGVALSVLAQARTQAHHHEDLGCSIQGPNARALRKAQAPLRRAIQQLGAAGAIEEAASLVRWMEAQPAYEALCEGKRRQMGRRVLRETVLYPAAERLEPRFLHLRQGTLGLDLPVPGTRAAWAPVADLLAQLARGATRPELRGFARASPACAELLEALVEARWLTPHPGALPLPKPGLTFVGHNTVLVSGRRARVLVDPYFRPSSEVDLPDYQPMAASDLGPIDAVVITHSHGDHFHLGSLLPLPRDTRIFVPAVTRESLFSTDCALRLEQLGFTRVERLPWGQARRVGDVDIQALPFYGEQPTDERGPYPALFNEGNTWLVRTPTLSAAFFADAGRDARGDMRDVCKRVRRETGPVDVLFCGVRGFRLRPLFFGATTLEAFLVNVPLHALTRPVSLMADVEEALGYGALLGARHVVPCADGGAPWYWREGMGPRYPGYPGVPVPGASTHDENPDADPYPERMFEVHAQRARKARSAAGAQPEPLLLRPGDAVSSASLRGSRPPRLRRFPRHRWPFGGAGPVLR